MDFSYYEVEFLNKPHASVPRFVCVPSSWMRSSSGHTAEVFFPKEPFVATEGRIIAGESSDDAWNIHAVTIKSACDDLNEGRQLAVRHCSENNVQEDDHDQNVQFKTPVQAVKRSGVRSMSVDERFLNREKRGSNIQMPHDISCPQINTQDYDEDKKKIDREKRALKRLSEVLTELNEEFDNASDFITNMNKVVLKIKNSLTSTANMTDNFLNKEKPQQRRKATPCTKKSPISVDKLPDHLFTNTKWTKRFREFQDGLSELLPGSKIYVRQYELQKLAKVDNPMAAAYILMEEIFSDDALRFCSLAGGKGGPGGFKVIKKYGPPLNEHARKVMMKFLKKYAKKRDWTVDEGKIWMMLRKRLLAFKNGNKSINI